MVQPIISVEHIGKAYKLGLREEMYPTFREAIVGAATAPLRRFRHLGVGGNQDDMFWALRDVSFDVHQGEVVGIIGRNGAGKSTLLKVLSRITEPTAGRAVLRGRVASLLEVGTGFHPELTGRENIYLNGSILGMKKLEIDRKFDEIVAFAEVEKFLDTPVKRYSSGMYVRLAFAVAAHLEPEILIVDEVLAVGDAQFQRKCLGKMHDVAERDGRTVLFVSHNLGAIRSLCASCMNIEQGRIVNSGDVDDVITTYLEGNNDGSVKATRTLVGDVFEFLGVQFVGPDDNPLLSLQPAQIRIAVRVLKEVEDVGVRLDILDEFGNLLMGIPSWLITRGGKGHANEDIDFTFGFPSLPLTPGLIRVAIRLQDHGRFKSWDVSQLHDFTVGAGPPFVGRRAERRRVGPVAADVSVTVSRGCSGTG